MDISLLSQCVPGGGLCKPSLENAGEASRSYSKQKPKGKESTDRGRDGEGRGGLGRDQVNPMDGRTLCFPHLLVLDEGAHACPL